jgi:hypothetical protein
MDSSFDLKLAQGLVLTQYRESNKHMKEDKTTADILVLHVAAKLQLVSGTLMFLGC